MNGISNYSMANVNYNNEHRNPNFKALIVTKEGKEVLGNWEKVLKKDKLDLYEEQLLPYITKKLNLLKEIKSFAQKSKFYDIVFDGDLGVKRSFADISSSRSCLGIEDNEVFAGGISLGKLNKKQVKNLTPNSEGYLTDNMFIKVFKYLEKNAQDAQETIKELLG